MKFSLFPFFLFISFLSTSQVNEKKLNEFFNEIEKTSNGMGTVSVSLKGKEIYSKSIGYSNYEQKLKANNRTKYRIGSLSKTYTSTIVLKLIEEGKIKLTTKIKKFFPELPSSKKITIEHLLRHKSGVYNFTNSMEYFSYNHLEISRTNLLKKIYSHKSQFKPGSKFEYSNSNYVLLTFIAEDVTNKSFSKLIDDYIVKPLSLDRTSFGGTTDSTDNEAFSYSEFGGWEREKITHMSVPLGAGGIAASPQNVNVFLEALFTGKILNHNSLVDMLEFQGDWNYGLGVYKSSQGDSTWVGHNGGVDGFQTFGFYHPESEVGVCYVSNGTIYPISKITNQVVKIIQNDSVDTPKLISPKLAKEIDIIAYEGMYSLTGFPLKIEIKLKSNTLFAQATGQAEFPLTQVGVGKYEYVPAGVRILFNSESKELVLIQRGQRITFIQE